MHRKLRLPYMLGASLLGAVTYGLSPVQGDAPPQPVPAPPELHASSGITTDVENSQVSLSLRETPVTHMMSLLTLMTNVHFRYATPPDAKITATFNEVPLVPTLAAWLGATGFELHHAGSDYFVFRDVTAPPFLPTADVLPGAAKPPVVTSAAVPPSWQYWSWPVAPPARWMMPGATGSATMEMEARSAAETGWQPATQGIIPELYPGISVTVPALATGHGAAKPIYLRCLMPLKFVPDGAQLVLETPAEATLYVNGSLLLRRWKGRRVLDLSRVLTAGHNCLSIQWSPEAAKAVATGSPVLRYEWFFAGDGG